MNINYISNPIYVDWLKDDDGNKISLPVNNEQKQVADNKIVLDYIPDQFYKVTFQSGSTPTVEISINDAIISPSQYKVDYSIGFVYLHPSLEASVLTFNYYKKGMMMYPASRIYTKLSDSGASIESTLQEQVSILATYDYKGVYNNTQAYVKNNIVYYNGSTYMCSVDTTIGAYPTDINTWRVMASGYNEMGDYSGSTQYYMNDVVWYDATKSKYTCIAKPTIGTIPTNVTYWDKLVDFKSIYDAEALRVTAESSRVTVESARVTAESGRVSTESARVTAESSRVGVESARVTAETGRVNAESSRVTVESGRVTAESGRVSAESTRGTNETTRGTNETARGTAEGLRVTAESGRVTAESGRTGAETTRVGNETTRGTNETGRTTAEGLRVTAESGRVTAEGTRTSAETTRGTNETSRTTAEGLRVTAESSRVTVEGARVTAESGRSTAEGLRVSAETTRGTNETTRGTNETGRTTAESSRVTVEGNRVTAETGRVNAESTRVSNETTRGTNETNRGTAESGRVTAEGLRVSAESARVTAEGLRVTAETGRNTAETGRQTSMNNLVHMGDYAGATAYQIRNIVAYQGSSFMCILASTNNLPTNTTYWKLVGQAGSNLTFTGNWSAVTSYVTNNVVSLSNVSYVCSTPNLNQTPPNASYWTVLSGLSTNADTVDNKHAVDFQYKSGDNEYALGVSNTATTNIWYEICNWSGITQYGDFQAVFQLSKRGQTPQNAELWISGEITSTATGWGYQSMSLRGTQLNAEDYFALVFIDNATPTLPKIAKLYYKRNSDWNQSSFVPKHHHINSTITWTYTNTSTGTTVDPTGSMVLKADSTQNYYPIATTNGTQTLFNKSFADSSTFIVDNVDATKKLLFEVSGVTTGTTRTLTIPDKSGTIFLNITGGTTNNIVTRDASGIPIDSGKIFNDAGTTVNDIWSASKTQTAINAILGSADAMQYKGILDCSTNPNYPVGNAGEIYRVSVAGKIGGASGAVVEINDLIMCNTDGTSAGDQATVGTKWNVIQTNIDGAVISADTVAVDGQIIVESGTSGKIIKKSVASIDATGKMLTTSLGLGSTPTFLPNNPLAMNGNAIGYVQAHIQNLSSATPSSGDFVVTADTGNDTTNYIDMGINSSGYSDSTFTISGALDGYLYTSNSHLAIGTALATKTLKFFTGGTLTANERMRIIDTGIMLPATSFINDANSNELIKFVQTASAVNEITIKNNITANAPEIQASGGDTNIDLAITPKGTGTVKISGGISMGNYLLQGNTTDKSLDIIFTG
jgi:hypothetical protein